MKRTARALQASGVQISGARLQADGTVYFTSSGPTAEPNPEADLDAEMAAWRAGRA